MPVSRPAMHRHGAIAVHPRAGLSIIAVSAGHVVRAETTRSTANAAVGSAAATRSSPRPTRRLPALDGGHAEASAAGDPMVGEGGRRRRSGSNPAMLAVLRIAAKIEPDPAAVLEWYRSTPISKLENRPAEQLVALGRVADVIAFLWSIRDDMRA